MIWLGWFLWHINHFRLFNAISSLYIYIKYIWFWIYFVDNIIKRTWALFFNTVKWFQVLLYNNHSLTSVICLLTFCSFWPIDRTQPGATNLSLRGPGINSDEGLLHISQISKAGALPLDALQSYQDTHWRRLTPLQRYSRYILLPQMTWLAKI